GSEGLKARRDLQLPGRGGFGDGAHLGRRRNWRSVFAMKEGPHSPNDLLRRNKDWCAGMYALKLRINPSRKLFQYICTGKDNVGDLRGDVQLFAPHCIKERFQIVGESMQRP